MIFLTIFREGLGEAYDGEIAFVSSLENFGGGHNDPHFVALGGKPHRSLSQPLAFSYKTKWLSLWYAWLEAISGNMLIWRLSWAM